MSMIEPVSIHCPYCGESFDSAVDLSQGSHLTIEDCAVCCRPIELRVRVDDNDALISVESSTDSD